VDARSDIFSFGVVLYELLAGRRPFAGATDLERLQALISRPYRHWPNRRWTCPLDLRNVVEKALEKDPAERYQSARELVVDLRRLTRAIPSAKRGVTRSRRQTLEGDRAGCCGGRWRFRSQVTSTFSGPPTLTDKDTIVLADFDNTTGDPVFDDTLRQGLSVELQQSPFLSLIPDRQVQQTLALMGQPKDARLTSEVAQQICERTASAMVLEGSIASLGSQYVLGLHARNCNTGTTVDQEQVQVAKREDVLNSLSEIGRKLRTRLGESRATVEKHSTPLAEATTPSLEALKAYSTGTKAVLSGDVAAPYLPSGARLKSIPNSRWRTPVWGLRTAVLESRCCQLRARPKAWESRDRVSDWERFFIDFTYNRQVTGNLEKAYQTLELWLQTYPRGQQPGPLGS
jgi:hypothetical protein